MPQLNVLFWNVGRKDLTEQIVNLARSKEVDILVLAENPVESTLLKTALEEGTNFSFYAGISVCKKITLVTKFDNNQVATIRENSRMTIRKIQLSDCPVFLFAALHLMDKRSASNHSQTIEAQQFVSFLDEIEQEYKTNRLVVVGDFNMNPFDIGMITASGFHASMSRQVAQRQSRKVQGKSYSYFYNPCWGLLGDIHKDIPGTYYYKPSGHDSYGWNVLDQVILRPSLISNFVKESLEIIHTDGVNSLITTNQVPRRSVYSDHLPLFFTLKF